MSSSFKMSSLMRGCCLWLVRFRGSLFGCRGCANTASVTQAALGLLLRLGVIQVKYVGDHGEEQNGLHMLGLNLIDKTMTVRGARIAYSIWDVAGNVQSVHHIPNVCKDVVALYMLPGIGACCLDQSTQI